MPWDGKMSSSENSTNELIGVFVFGSKIFITPSRSLDAEFEIEIKIPTAPRGGVFRTNKECPIGDGYNAIEIHH